MPPTPQTAPAAARNRAPILAILKRVLPPTALVLEIASGTGEHAAWFAADLPATTWQPTDQDPDRLASIEAWRQATGTPNLRPPLHLDAAAPQTWPIHQADAILAINMVHIAPWSATIGLMQGAARLLPPSGPLILYGPYRVPGTPTAPSNEAFDADLRARNPAWGLRDLDTVSAAADTQGLALQNAIPMPANNLTLVFTRRP